VLRTLRVVAPLICVVLMVPLAPVVSAGGSAISVSDDEFTPSNYHLPGPGPTVPWVWGPGLAHEHNVRQDVKLFRSGEPTSDPGIYEKVFSAGTFHYYCEVHGTRDGGMDGKVRVPVGIQGTADRQIFRVIWATETSRTGKAFDVKYRVDDGPWVAWRTDTTKLRALFGRNDKPVPVEEGLLYEVRSRSQKRVDRPKKVSGWSPISLYFFEIPG
jgi:plastocyanin